jgi:HK97 family phage major capsid protein
MSNAAYITRELEARAKDEMDARAILDAASAETRELTPEESERFDRFVASSETRKERAAKLSKLDADAAAATEMVRSLGEIQDPSSGLPQGTARVRQDAEVARLVMAHSSEYRSGQSPAERGIELGFDMGEVRAINDFTNGAALYASDFSSRVAVYARTMSPWLANATVINATNGRPLVLPRLTADPTTYTPGEGTAITEATPTISGATATPVSYKGLSYVSFEADEDEVIGLMQLISQAQGRSIGLAFGTAATAAVLAAATNGGTASGLGFAGTATYLGYEDLLDLKFGAAAPYRMNGGWVMSNGAIKKIRKFKSTTGEYAWEPSVALGTPDIFDGNPVYEDPALADVGSATKSVLFGDLSAWVVKQMPLRVAVSTEARFATDEIAIKSVYRAGGALPDATALRYVVSANS